MHRGEDFGACLCLAGVSRAALGAAPALGGRCWHRSRLLRAEIPAGFVLPWSHRVSAVDGDVPRADSATGDSPRALPRALSPASGPGAKRVAGWRSERDARGRWYPPGVVSCHPPVCRFLATKLLLGCLRGSGDGSSLGFGGLVSPGWLPLCCGLGFAAQCTQVPSETRVGLHRSGWEEVSPPLQQGLQPLPRTRQGSSRAQIPGSALWSWDARGAGARVALKVQNHPSSPPPCTRALSSLQAPQNPGDPSSFLRAEQALPPNRRLSRNSLFFHPTRGCSSVRITRRLATQGNLQKRGGICSAQHTFCASKRVFGVERSLPRSTALPAALQHPLDLALQHLVEVPAPSRPARGGSPLRPRPPP